MIFSVLFSVFTLNSAIRNSYVFTTVTVVVELLLKPIRLIVAIMLYVFDEQIKCHLDPNFRHKRSQITDKLQHPVRGGWEGERERAKESKANDSDKLAGEI